MSGMLGLNVSCHHVTFLDLGQPLLLQHIQTGNIVREGQFDGACTKVKLGTSVARPRNKVKMYLFATPVYNGPQDLRGP